MKKIILSFLFSASALVIIAQNVLTIDDQNISLDEFKNIFYKNNNNIEFTKEYLDEYMNLFVNFSESAFVPSATRKITTALENLFGPL